MAYFTFFPKTTFKTQSEDVFDIVDITKRIEFFEKFRRNDFYSSDYLIEDGETPQSLAQDFYNDAGKDWVILHMNKVVDPLFDWVMDTNTFERYLSNKYPISTDYPGGPDTNYLWVLPDGRFYPFIQTNPNSNVGNNPDMDATGLSVQAQRVTYREYENKKNEAKRMIRILDPGRIGSVIIEFELKMKSLINSSKVN